MFFTFINDLLFFINEAKLANFADDNTFYATKRDLNELLRLQEKGSEVSVKWCSDNRQNTSNHNCCLTTNNAEIKSKELVTLLDIETDNRLNFKKHVPIICKGIK